MTTMDHLNEIVDWKNGSISPAIHFDEEVYKRPNVSGFGTARGLSWAMSMVATPGSYVTNYMGEVPVILTKDRLGSFTSW